MKKIIYSIFLVLFAVSIMAMPALAAQFEAGPQYVLSKDNSVGGNLYAAGNNISVNGIVEGDLISAGQTINVYGRVRDDVAAAGANLNFMGEIGGDLRTAGGFINIGTNINGDTIAAGGEIKVLKDISLNGDARLAGGNVDIQGNINGRAKISSGKVVINGRIAQDIDITANEELVIGDSAVIEGKLTYKAPKPATISDKAQISKEPTYEVLKGVQKGAQRRTLLGVFTAFFLVKLIIMLFSALVIHWLFRKWTEMFIKETVANFGREAVRGFIFLIVIPVAIILSFVTVIASFFGIIGILWYIVSLIVASVFSGILLGGWLSKYLYSQTDYTVDWKSISLGVILLALVSLIPFVGWIVVFIVFSAAFGSLLNFCYQRVWLSR